MDNSEKKYGMKAIIAMLLLLLAGCFAYIFKVKTQNQTFYKELTVEKSEKESILNSLRVLKATYDKAIAENTTLSNELKIEREKVIKLISELENTKSNSETTIAKFRNQYNGLKNILDGKIAENEELKKKNLLLTTERDSTIILADKQKKINDTLIFEKKKLTSIVSKGAELVLYNLKVSPLKLYDSEKQVETEKASKAKFLKIGFSIHPNPIAKKGTRKYLVQISDPNDHILGERSNETFGKINITYSLPISIEYKNIDDTAVGYLDAAGVKFEKGVYNVNVYEKHSLVANSSFTLN